MSKRTEKVAAQLIREIADIVNSELTDPRLGFVTFTGAEVAPDLTRATIYYTVLGDEKEKKATLAALISSRHYLRNALAHRLRLKRIPELYFTYDEAVEHGMRIFSRLQELKKKVEDGED